MPLPISLNSSSGIPFYKQIVNFITYGVINGLLKPGEKLPTVRQLAVDLQVNLNTIVKAYSELEIKGIVHTQQGTGTFIAQSQPKVDAGEKDKQLRSLCTVFVDELSSAAIELDDAISVLKKIAAERKIKK